MVPRVDGAERCTWVSRERSRYRRTWPRLPVPDNRTAFSRVPAQWPGLLHVAACHPPAEGRKLLGSKKRRLPRPARRGEKNGRTTLQPATFQLAGCGRSTYTWRRAVTVSPSVAIVGLLVFLILALVGLIRAKPEDIPKLFRGFGRWFGK